jgi:tetratricopeptide (TPR) repeat protein
MGERGYLDFDLLIERSGEGFRAKVIDSPSGQAVAEFKAPFVDMEVENFVLRMGRKRGIRRMDSPEMQSAKEFGSRLFNAVFNGDVRGCLRSSLDEARQKELGLRIRLRLADAPELSDLPWEYLYNSQLNRFLALSNETPLIRYLDLAEAIRPLSVDPPIRVLAMISSPSDFGKLNVDLEKTKLQNALGMLCHKGLVELDVLEEATLGMLQQRLRENEYHIFHFIGHGGFDQRTEEGRLMFLEDDKTGRPVTAQFLGALLHDERTLRLAVLNACEGARTSRCDPFSGTAQSLVQQGIPAVIAMQFDVSDDAAIAFTQEFYKAIAIGYPVDAALAEGRKAIYAQVNEVEWGTPVLYMRAPDGNIFDVTEIDERELHDSKFNAIVREGEQFLVSEDWPKAIEKLQQALALNEKDPEVRAKLTRALQQQELARLYANGRVAYDANRWSEALDYFHKIQNIKPDYRGVEPLIRTIEKELARSKDAEQKQVTVTTLMREADAALGVENWPVVIEKLESLLNLDPSNSEASSKLVQARRQIERKNLYNQARRNFETGRMQEALRDLKYLRQSGPYKDVDQKIQFIEQRLASDAAAAAAAANTAARAPTPPVYPVTPPPQQQSSAFAGVKLLSIGGCIGALVVLGILAFLILLAISESSSSY